MNERALEKALSSYLKEKRLVASMSQGDVAARSDVFGLGLVLDQRSVSRIEDRPLSADAIKIAAYMTAIGCKPEDYYDQLKLMSVKQGVTAMSKDQFADIRGKINRASDTISGIRSIFDENQHDYLESYKLAERVEVTLNSLNSLNRKPVIGTLGLFDNGKSTVNNSILGQQLLPERYQPATAVNNLVMHEEDRPASINGKVAIFRTGFMPHMIHDQGFVDAYLIEQGDLSVLDRLGVHNYDEELGNDAYLAVIFSDAPILQKIWLLDTPGDCNNEESGDSEKAVSGVELADGILYVSAHKGFMATADVGFASNVLRLSPPVDRANPLAHVLFVQSHCHGELTETEVKGVSRIAFKRCRKQFEQQVFDHWKENEQADRLPDHDEIVSRVQPFWRENETYRDGLIQRVSELADFLTQNHAKHVENSIERTMIGFDRFLASCIGDLESKKKATEERVQEVEEKEARFRDGADELIAALRGVAGSCRKDYLARDLDLIRDFYETRTSENGLTKIIQETYDDKKQAKDEIGEFVGQMFSARLESMLRSSGKQVANEVEALIAKWQELVPDIDWQQAESSVDGVNFDGSGFNAHAAFIGGLSGLGSLGAMALYVSTISSNLGAYILVGKAAGVLTTLGITSSVTTLPALVSMLGGPITIGIAIAAGIGYLVYRFMGRTSWQEDLAKKVAKSIKKEGFLDKLEEPVQDFWNSTADAVNAGISELIKQTDEHIEAAKKSAATEYDVQQLDHCAEIITKGREGLK